MYCIEKKYIRVKCCQVNSNRMPQSEFACHDNRIGFSQRPNLDAKSGSDLIYG